MIMKEKKYNPDLSSLIINQPHRRYPHRMQHKQASASTGTSTENSQQADGGVLTLKVNPEIDISYDDRTCHKGEVKMMMEIRLLQNMRIIAERIAVR